MGEYYSALAEPNANPKPHPGALSISVRHTRCAGSFADFDLRFSAGDADSFPIAVTVTMGQETSRSRLSLPARLNAIHP